MVILQSILRTMNDEVKQDENHRDYPVFRLPSITWSKREVTALVGYYGLEEAIKRIASTVFTEKYVRETLDLVLKSEYEFTNTEGTTSNDDV